MLRRFAALSLVPRLGFAILVMAAAVAAHAQVPDTWTRRTFAREDVPQRRGFVFCRLAFNQTRYEPGGRGWTTDYPLADQNLMIRLGEFTTTTINLYDDGQPAHAVVRGTDPELFECPFLFASDVGTATFSTFEAASLREYLLKGGFLWVDDFWGDRAMAHWLGEIDRILPGYERTIMQPDDPIFSTYYFLDGIPQIANIGFWRRSGGRTSERGAESANQTLSGIHAENGRLMVLMSHNTDIADGWEREAEDYDFFARFSPPAYAVAVNVLVHAMTR